MSEEWVLEPSKWDSEKARQLIMEARMREYSKHELELADLLEEALGFEDERKTYYNAFKLVKENWNVKLKEITDLKEKLAASEASDKESIDMFRRCRNERDDLKRSLAEAVGMLREAFPFNVTFDHLADKAGLK